jgi:hypothetical protein
MAIFVKDGLTLVPELADDAVLTSNILPRNIKGRTAISEVFVTLERFYTSIADVERTSLPERELIVSSALLPSSNKIFIHIVGLRDTEGWISQVVMTHEPKEVVVELISLLSEAPAVYRPS